MEDETQFIMNNFDQNEKQPENADDIIEYLEDEVEIDAQEKNDEEEDEIESVSSKNNDEVIFMKVLSKYGKPLLQKSQTPAMKAKKKESLRSLAEHLSEAGILYTESQIKKKFENMKTRLKKKIDSKKTGNLPIQLKAAEKMLMNALDGNENPAITRLKFGSIIIGTNQDSEQSAQMSEVKSSSKASSSSSSKKSIPSAVEKEKDEKVGMQRKLFQEQMEVFRMQKELIA